MDNIDQLQRFDRLLADRNVVSLTDALQRECRHLGFEHACYWLLWPEKGQRKPVYATNYPHDWLRRHLALGYDSHDMIGRISAQTIQPFMWADVTRRRLTPMQRRVFDEAADFGLKAGGAVPIHGPGLAKACLSIVGALPEQEARDLFRLNSHKIELLAYWAHERMRSFDMNGDTTAANLSPHEIEALTWTARGLTRHQTAREMNVLDETVKTHLQRARQKLSAKNNAQAVAIAVLRAFILP